MKSRNYFCCGHILPWCRKYEKPCYHCGCLYCQQLPVEWRNIKNTTCRYFTPEKYIPNREKENLDVRVQKMKSLQSKVGYIVTDCNVPALALQADVLLY